MNKQITTALLLTSLFSASAVSAGDWFIGGQYGKTKMEYDGRGPSGSSERDSEIGVRVGKMYSNHRLMGSFTYNELSSKEEQSQYLFSGDYFFGQSQLRPFVGATAGVNHYEYRSRNDSSLAYGVQAGVRYEISRNLSIEGAVQRLHHDNEVYYYGNKIKSDQSNKAVIALDYAF